MKKLVVERAVKQALCGVLLVVGAITANVAMAAVAPEGAAFYRVVVSVP